MDEKSFSPVPQKSFRELVVKIVIGAVVAVVVLAGIFLIARSLMSNPDIVIKRMLSNMEKVKTMGSEIEMDFSLIDEDSAKGINISLGFNVDSDVTSRENPKMAGEFDISFSVSASGQIPQTTTDFQITGEGRAIGETSYLKLDNLDIPDELEFFLMMFGIDKSGLEKQWIRLEEKDLESLGLEKSGKLSPEEQLLLEEKISDVLKEKKIYYVKQVLSDQEINGKKARHYLLGIDEENFSQVIKEVLKFSLEYMDEDSLEAGTRESFIAAGITESVKEILRKIDGLDIEIWIGKKDNYLYKVNLEKYIDSSVFVEDSRGKALIGFSVVFSNFNQPVKIEAPENFIRFEEIIPSFLPPGFPLFERTPEIYLPPDFEEPAFEYPFEGSILEQGPGLYGLPASLLEIFSGFLK